MNILRRSPCAVLWLYGSNNSTAARNLRLEAAARGVAAERIVVAPRVSKAAHLRRHLAGTVYLDTHEYGAHTSCSDALVTGLPVVTMPSASFASRVGSSILRAAGADSLIAVSAKDYTDLALRLTRTTLNAALRTRLAQHRSLDGSSPSRLFDAHVFQSSMGTASRAALEVVGLARYDPPVDSSMFAMAHTSHVVVSA